MGSAIRESRSVSYYYLTVFLRLLTHTDSRTRGQQTFRISSAKMDLYLSSFFSLQIIRDWNRLPPAVISVSPMESFKLGQHWAAFRPKSQLCLEWNRANIGYIIVAMITIVTIHILITQFIHIYNFLIHCISNNEY